MVRPLVCRVEVAKDGRLYPTDHVMVPRDILQPLDQDNFTIGTMVDLDAFLSVEEAPWFEPADEYLPLSEEVHHGLWRTYLAFCWKMLRTVGKAWVPDQDCLMRAEHGLLFKEGNPDGFSQNIVRLYSYVIATCATRAPTCRFSSALLSASPSQRRLAWNLIAGSPRARLMRGTNTRWRTLGVMPWPICWQGIPVRCLR